MSDQMNVAERLKGPTPPFFKRVINYAMTIAGIGTALLGTNLAVTLPPILHTVAQWMVVAGVVASAVSKTTVAPCGPVDSEKIDTSKFPYDPPTPGK